MTHGIPRYFPGRFGRAGALVCCAGLGLIGQAEAVTGSSTYSNAVTVYTPTAVAPGSSVANVAGGGARAVAKVDIFGPGGRGAVVDASVKVSARGALAIGSRFLPYASGIGLAYEIYRAVRVKPGATPSDPLLFDEGQSSVIELADQWATRTHSSSNTQATGWFSSRNEACQEFTRTVLAANPGTTNTFSYWVGQPSYMSGQYVCRVEVTSNGVKSTHGESIFATRVGNVDQCPAYVDAWTGQSIPKGQPKDLDGKCDTGRYTRPMTPLEAADQAVAQARTVNLDYGALLNEALGRGPVELPAGEAVGGFSGPMPTIPGAVTETRKPDGSTETITEAYDLTPGIGDSWPIKGTWRDKKTTVTTNAQGQVTGTTTTTTTPPVAASGASPSTPTKADDPCTADPGRLGCIGLGQAPSEVTPKRTFTLSWAEEAVNLPSGCPSPQALPGLPAVDYKPMCDAATRMRPFVLIGATFSALMLVVATLRGA